jgi:hypothetical protein
MSLVRNCPPATAIYEEVVGVTIFPATFGIVKVFVFVEGIIIPLSV